MTRIFCVAAFTALLVWTGIDSAFAQGRQPAPYPDGFHKTLKEGLEASKRSGKPVLLLTIWGPNV